MSRALLCVLVLSACAPARQWTPLPRVVFVPGATREPARPELPAITGLIVDGSGRPLEYADVFVAAVDERGALLAWEGGRSPFRWFSSDGSGFFTGHAQPGRYALTLDAFATATCLHTGDNVELIDQAARLVRGQVVDSKREPIAQLGLDASLRSLTDGHFEFWSRRRSVDLRAAGVAPRRLWLPSQREPIDFGQIELEPGRLIRGTITDARSRAPIENALVQLPRLVDHRYSSVDVVPPDWLVPQRSDSRGEFSARVQEMDQELVVTAPGYLSATVRLDNTQSLAVELDIGLIISGHIDGPPVAELSLQGQRGRVDPDGNFVLSGLKPGRAGVGVHGSTLFPGEVELVEGRELLLVARRGGATVVTTEPPPVVFLSLVPGRHAIPSTKQELERLVLPGIRQQKDRFLSVPAGPATVFAIALGGPALGVSAMELEVPASGEVIQPFLPSSSAAFLYSTGERIESLCGEPQPVR